MEREISVKTLQGATEVIDIRGPLASQLSLSIRLREATVVIEEETTVEQEIDQHSVRDIMEALSTGVYMAEQDKNQVQSKTASLGKRMDPNRGKSLKKLKPDQKRQRVLDNIISEYESSFSTYAELARRTKASYSTVTKTVKKYEFTKIVPLVNTFYKDRRQVVKTLVKGIAERDSDPYFSTQSIKRQLVQSGLKVSKPMISKMLKSMGLRFLDIQIKAKSDKYKDRQYDLDDLQKILNFLSQGVLEKQVIPIFVDEFIAPLDQIPKKMWRRGRGRQTRSQKRSLNNWLYVAASADYNGFLTIAIFSQQLKTQDFEFYMTKTHSIVKKYYPSQPVMYFGDRASWHLGPEFQRSPIFKIFKCNQPGLFSINYIEQLFSVIRYLFRTRPFVRLYHEEVALLYHIFKTSNQLIQESGFERNHVRALFHIMQRFWPDIRLNKYLKIN